MPTTSSERVQAPELEQRERGEGLNGRPEDDIALRAAAEALASMHAAANEDGVDGAGNEVLP